MIQRIKFLAVAAIAAVLVACGGGGDDTTPNFAGNYSFSTFTKTTDTCGGTSAATIEGGTDVIVQNGREITAGESKGTVDGDNGGYTLSETQVINGVTVVASIAVRSTSPGATTFNVQLSSVGTLGNVTCSNKYKGTSTKD